MDEELFYDDVKALNFAMNKEFKAFDNGLITSQEYANKILFLVVMFGNTTGLIDFSN